MKSKFIVNKLNSYLVKKQAFLIFLLLIVGVVVPTFSSTIIVNFWYCLYRIFVNSMFNFFFCIALGFNTIFYIAEYFKNYTIVSRYENYQQSMQVFIKDIIWITIYYSLISLILGISGAMLVSFGHFELISHPIYKIPLLLYLIFAFLRKTIFVCIVSVIIYLLVVGIKKVWTYIVLVAHNFLFFFCKYNEDCISHFYKMPILYNYYFLDICYSSFGLEVLCTLLEICLLLIIYKVIWKIVTMKKRDLL